MLPILAMAEQIPKALDLISVGYSSETNVNIEIQDSPKISSGGEMTSIKNEKSHIPAV